MATLLQDSFTAADNTDLDGRMLDVGGPWTAVQSTGSFRVQGNQALRSGSGVALLQADAGAAGYLAAVTASGPSSSVFGLVVRYQDATHYWLAAVDDDSGVVGIWRNNGGTLTLLASAPYTGGAGLPNSFAATCAGPTIAVTVGADSVSYGAATDFQTATRCGLYVSAGSLTTWDNFLVTGEVTPPPPKRLTVTVADRQTTLAVVTIDYRDFPP